MQNPRFAAIVVLVVTAATLVATHGSHLWAADAPTGTAAPATALTPLPPPTNEAGFVPLFNGKDLAGWVPVNVAPNTFTVRDGVILSTGVPTGIMRTERQYENFVIELEWMHRARRQRRAVRLGRPADRRRGRRSPGGSRCRSSTTRTSTSSRRRRAVHRPRRRLRDPRRDDEARPAAPARAGALPAERERAQARRGVEPLPRRGARRRRSSWPSTARSSPAGRKCSPRKGYICLESEGRQATSATSASRNCRARTPRRSRRRARPRHYADLHRHAGGLARGAGRCRGVDGQDWNVVYKSDGQTRTSLWTEKEYGDVTLIVDWRFTDKPGEGNGAQAARERPRPPARTKRRETRRRRRASIRGIQARLVNIMMDRAAAARCTAIAPMPSRTSLRKARRQSRGRTPARRMEPVRHYDQGQHVTVVLNGQTVIADAVLADLPAEGPIGLVGAGDGLEFGNVLRCRGSSGSEQRIAVRRRAGVAARTGIDSELVTRRSERQSVILSERRI